MSYIDVLIPGVIGALLIVAPKLFTKAQGEDYEKTQKKFRVIGFVLLGVAALYLAVKFAQAA